MRPHRGDNFTAVVKDNYKLYTPGNGVWSLYDLSSDIGEEHNIADQYPGIVESMKKAVYKWTWKQERPRFFDNPAYGFETSWKSTNMPNFVKTFGSLYNKHDYSSGITAGIKMKNASLENIYPTLANSQINVFFDSGESTSADAALYDMQGRMVQLEVDLNQTGNNKFVQTSI